MSIGETIKSLRTKKGMTQEELANALGVSSQAISKWETDKSMPDVSLLMPLSRELGVGVDDLLGGDRYKKFNDEFQKQLPLGPKATLLVSEAALKEFPNDFTFLYRRACDELFFWEDTQQMHYLHSATNHFCELVNKFPDKEPAKSMYSLALSALGQKEKALELAYKCEDRDSLLKRILEGEELLVHKQRTLNKEFWSFYRSLISYNTEESLNTARELLNIMYDSDEYMKSDWLIDFHLAELYLKQGDNVKFACHLEKSYELAKKRRELRHADMFNYSYNYKSELFNKLSIEYPEDMRQFYLADRECFASDSVYDLKKRIVQENIKVVDIRLRTFADYKFFYIYFAHHKDPNLIDAGMRWDLPEDEWMFIVDQQKNPDYEYRGFMFNAQLAYAEKLYNEKKLTGYLAFIDSFVSVGFCNAGDREKYRKTGFNVVIEHSEIPEGARVMTIEHITVSSLFKFCGIEESFIDRVVSDARDNGYEYIESCLDEDGIYMTHEMYQSLHDLYISRGFEVSKQFTIGGRIYVMFQKKL